MRNKFKVTQVQILLIQNTQRYFVAKHFFNKQKDKFNTLYCLNLSSV